MFRYTGICPDRPKIAVIANDAIGNFVVATPLLQMLRRELNPALIHYYGGVRTLELQAESTLFEGHFPLHGKGIRAAFEWSERQEYDLIVNVEQGSLARATAGVLAGPETLVCGPCLAERAELPFPEDMQGDLWRDQTWIAPDLVDRYPFLQSGFIAEIYARLAYLSGDIPAYQVPMAEPQGEVPDVLIATSASLPDKLWPLEKWMQVLSELHATGHTVGVLGAKPTVQKEFWKGASLEDALVEAQLCHDLRGSLTLPEVAGALSSAKAVLTLDNGILHLACATSTPVVGLFRWGIHRLWAPPVANLTVLTPDEDSFVDTIEVGQVLEALEPHL